MGGQTSSAQRGKLPIETRHLFLQKGLLVSLAMGVVWASGGHYNKWPQACWLQTREIDSLTVLESRCWQGLAPSSGSRGKSVSLPLPELYSPQILDSWSFPSSSKARLMGPVSILAKPCSRVNLPASHKDSSDYV